MSKVVAHVTERQTFKSCRRQWKYGYRLHLVEKREPIRALWIGRALHYGLAEYYKNGRDPVEAMKEWIDKKIPPKEYALLWETEKEELRNAEALLTAMLSGYVEYAKANDDFEVVAVEEPISIRLPGTYSYLEGTLDLVLRRRGKLWVLDHKGYANFIDPSDLELDDQMTAYLWLVSQKYGELPAGAIYNQLRKKIPAEPMVLKNGALSRAKGIDTTPEKYRAAIQANGLNEDDYSDILSDLESNEFYRREYIARSEYELTHFAEHLTHELREMRQPKLPLYPNPGRDCSWGCSYRMLCLCENTGGDLQGLIDANYDVVEGRVL